MFRSPLRTAALRTAPLSTAFLWGGTRRKRLPRPQPLPEALLLHSQPAAPGYPGICCMASQRAQLAGDRSPSLRLQCKSKLCKPQLPAHVSGCPSSHPHPHGCTAPADRRAQRTRHTVQPTEPLKPCIHLPFLHVLWFSQLEILLTEQDVIPIQGKPLRQAVVFSLRHFNNPSWKEVIWEALTTF